MASRDCPSTGLHPIKSTSKFGYVMVCIGMCSWYFLSGADLLWHCSVIPKNMRRKRWSGTFSGTFPGRGVTDKRYPHNRTHVSMSWPEQCGQMPHISPLLSIGQGQKGLRSHFDVISGGPWLEEGTGGEGYPPTTVPLKIEVVEGFKIGGRPPPFGGSPPDFESHNWGVGPRFWTQPVKCSKIYQTL